MSKVEKRNKDANEIVESMLEELDSTKKHHVILMGDLNYRIDLEPVEVLQTLVQAQVRPECDCDCDMHVTTLSSSLSGCW